MKLQKMWGVWSLASLQPRADPEPCLHWNHSQPASVQPAWHRQLQSRALELGRHLHHYCGSGFASFGAAAPAWNPADQGGFLYHRAALTLAPCLAWEWGTAAAGLLLGGLTAFHTDTGAGMERVSQQLRLKQENEYRNYVC